MSSGQNIGIAREKGVTPAFVKHHLHHFPLPGEIMKGSLASGKTQTLTSRKGLDHCGALRVILFFTINGGGRVGRTVLWTLNLLTKWAWLGNGRDGNVVVTTGGL